MPTDTEKRIVINAMRSADHQIEPRSGGGSKGGGGG